MAVYNQEFFEVRNLISKGDFSSAYKMLEQIKNKCAEWFYIRGISAINIGYYDEGQDCIKIAKFMEPQNVEYVEAYDNYVNYRNDYDNRSQHYNRNRRNLDNSGCCCCCGGDCCDNLCKLWCADSCCECLGGDLITCC